MPEKPRHGEPLIAAKKDSFGDIKYVASRQFQNWIDSIELASSEQVTSTEAISLFSNSRNKAEHAESQSAMSDLLQIIEQQSNAIKKLTALYSELKTKQDDLEQLNVH